jgi:hypothetical protein
MSNVQYLKLARLAGIEPATLGFGVRKSILFPTFPTFTQSNYSLKINSLGTKRLLSAPTRVSKICSIL